VVGLLFLSACAGKTDSLVVDLGSPVPDPFSSHPIALEIKDQRGQPPTLVGTREAEPLLLEGEDVAALVRRTVVNAFRRSGLSVPEQPAANALRVVVSIDRLSVEILKTATSRVAFDGSLSVQALGQSKVVAEKFDTGAFGAHNKKRPIAKAIAKGMRRLEKQLETLGASLVKTSTAAR
jgi:hypothetical protein